MVNRRFSRSGVGSESNRTGVFIKRGNLEIATHTQRTPYEDQSLAATSQGTTRGSVRPGTRPSLELVDTKLRYFGLVTLEN